MARSIGALSMNMLKANLFPEYLMFEGQKILFRKKFHPDRIQIPNEGMNIMLGIRPDFFRDENFVDKESTLAGIEGVQGDLILYSYPFTLFKY